MTCRARDGGCSMTEDECERCGCVDSVFWYPWRFCDEVYYLCDDCQKKLAEWVEEVRYDND